MNEKPTLGLIGETLPSYDSERLVLEAAMQVRMTVMNAINFGVRGSDDPVAGNISIPDSVSMQNMLGYERTTEHANMLRDLLSLANENDVMPYVMNDLNADSPRLNMNDFNGRGASLYLPRWYQRRIELQMGRGREQYMPKVHSAISVLPDFDTRLTPERPATWHLSYNFGYSHLAHPDVLGESNLWMELSGESIGKPLSTEERHDQHGLNNYYITPFSLEDAPEVFLQQIFMNRSKPLTDHILPYVEVHSRNTGAFRSLVTMFDVERYIKEQEETIGSWVRTGNRQTIVADLQASANAVRATEYVNIGQVEVAGATHWIWTQAEHL